MSHLMRALLVEDEPLFVRVIEHVLHQSSIECVTAANGEEARRQLGREEFDLILLDLQLPDGGGLALVAEIEQNAALRSRTMIVTSFPLIGNISSRALPVLDKTDLVGMRDTIARFAAKAQAPQA